MARRTLFSSGRAKRNARRRTMVAQQRVFQRPLMEQLEPRLVLANFAGIGSFFEQQLLSFQTSALVSTNGVGGSLPVAGATLQALAQSGNLLSAATSGAANLNDNTTDPAQLEANLESQFGPGSVTDNGDDSFRIQFTNTSTINIANFTSGLGILPVNGSGFDATLTYTLDVTIGVDGSGFFIKADTAQPELQLNLEVADSALPELQVELGALVASATPQTEGDPALDLSYTVNVDGAKLRANDTFSLTTSVTGGADVDLDLTLVMSIAGVNPELTADFDLNWDLSSAANSPTVVFENVSLDLGSLVQAAGGQSVRTILDAAEPIFTLAHKFTEPLPGLSQLSDQIEGLVGDLNNVNTGVPVIDTILGAIADPTLVNFLDVAANLYPPSSDNHKNLKAAVEAINTINAIGEMVAGFADQSSLVIDFGTFTIGGPGVDLKTATGPLSGIVPSLDAPANPVDSQSGVSDLQNFLSENHLSTDLLDPTKVFQFLAGSDSVKVIEYARPFQATDAIEIELVNQNFAIGVVPANFQVGIVIDPVNLNARFGFDSRGITTGDIAQGLYVGAKGAADGAEGSLLTVGAHLNVDLSVGQDYEIASARVGVRGSIDAYGGVYFVEQPNGSGKLHVSEFGGSCIPLAGEVDVSANVSLFYDVRLDLDLEAILNTVKALVELAIQNNPAYFAVDKMVDVARDLLVPNVISAEAMDELESLADSPKDALLAVVNGFEAFGTEASKEFKKIATKFSEGAAGFEQYVNDRIPKTPEDAVNAIVTLGGALGLTNSGGSGFGASDSTVLFSRPILTWETGQCGSQDHGGGQTATPFVGDGGAVLGIVEDGVLKLHVGAQAALRSVEADEINEQVMIRPADPSNPANGEVVVSMFGASQTFSGVVRIEANAGEGENVLDGAGVGLPMNFVGGSGSDRFTAGLRNVIFFGGGGTNELIGSPENDLLYGGAGRDTIIGLPGDDQLYGYGGIDLLVGDFRQGDVNDDPDNPALFGNDLIHAGDGDDYVYAGPGADEVHGGLGSDVLYAGDGADLIYGGGGHEYIEAGSGNDVVFTGEGNSYIDGGEGNDQITAGQGINFLIGGEGDDIVVGNIVADVFFYSEGDGNDVLEGNGGENYLLLDLYSGGDYQLSADATHLEVSGTGTVGGTPTSLNVVAGNMTQVLVNLHSGGSEMLVKSLANTSVKYLGIELGLGRTGGIHLDLEGRSSADMITASVVGAQIEVLGAGPRIVFGNTTTTDMITIAGLAGDDDIRAAEGVELLGQLTLDGGSGDDFLAGRATLLGGSGDDVLQGSMGFADNIDGGAGVDTLLIRGTSIGDSINVRQTSASALSVSIGGTTDNETIAGLELVKIDGGGGADLISIGVADNLAGSLAFQVLGGGGVDRLVVRDEGLGDLALHRLGAGAGAGSVTVGALAAVEYDGVERVDINPLNTITGGSGADGLGRVLTIPFDNYEPNSDRSNAVPIGGAPTFIANLSIDPGPQLLGGAAGSVSGDEDWFEFHADKTGTFCFQALFDLIATSANGRAGLPGQGDLDIGLYSETGALIAQANGVAKASVDISVAAGKRYFARVYSASGINVYNFKVSEVDLSGPIVAGVSITSNPLFDLFSTTPALVGPTPAINSITIRIEDFVVRAPGDLYAALLSSVAMNRGNFTLRGDHSGVIPIHTISVANQPAVVGQKATATITLTFASYLPDDRYTLTISPEITDPAGNALDGNSNAATPGQVVFPSGDGVAGGAFTARFTVDSRPEVAVFSQGAITTDLNGNFRFDSLGSAVDAAHRDVVFQIGTISDNVFAGKFEPAALAQNDNDGFDKLGAYGYDNVAKEYRYLLDLNHDGAFDVRVRSRFQVNAVPVAGNFAPGRAGDEIGLFDGQSWYLDTNGDNDLDTRIVTMMRGLPIVGDFNGDGADDLATYDPATNVFSFDLDRDGSVDDAFTLDQLNPAGSDNGTGIDNGYSERPFTGDWNLDGIDDLGLVVPARDGSPTQGQSDWYMVVSDVLGQALPRNVFKAFSPSPLGNDLSASFGGTASVPLFGNFDPPVGDTPPAQTIIDATPGDPVDVDGDGFVTPLDALLIINWMNRHENSSWEIPPVGSQDIYLDVNGDLQVSPIDALIVINRLNAAWATGEAEGEGVPVVQRGAATGSIGESNPTTESAVDVQNLDWIIASIFGQDSDEEED